MATAYLDRAKLESLIGVLEVASAESASSADIAAVIESQCAMVDAYVSAQIALPPSATAIAQVAPIVADLVYCALYASGGSPELAARKNAALKQLRDISAKPPVMLLHIAPVLDDPLTPDTDESGTGAACGSAPRLTGWGRLVNDSCW